MDVSSSFRSSSSRQSFLPAAQSRREQRFHNSNSSWVDFSPNMHAMYYPQQQQLQGMFIPWLMPSSPHPYAYAAAPPPQYFSAPLPVSESIKYHGYNQHPSYFPNGSNSHRRFNCFPRPTQNHGQDHREKCNALLKQIEYYFSKDNLVRDTYLRGNMDSEGWVSVDLISGFPRVKRLTHDERLIVKALQPSTIVEVQEYKMRRRGDWMDWVLPCGFSSSTHPSPHPYAYAAAPPPRYFSAPLPVSDSIKYHGYNQQPSYFPNGSNSHRRFNCFPRMTQNHGQDRREKCNALLKQIEYYFSKDNLVRDTYLRGNMDIKGWVSVDLISGFPRVNRLTQDKRLIVKALQPSTIVEVQGYKMRRRGDWMDWILPCGSSSSTHPSPNTLVTGVQNL